MENNKAPAIIAGIVALALIGGGIFWFVNNNNNDSTANNETSQTQQESAPAEEEQAAEVNIVALASDTSALSTLVTAVKAAELVDTLQAAGPFTVFAPTNDAFAALPEGTLDTLLKPENKDQLTSILTYHVVAGEVLAGDLTNGQEIKTVQGGTLKVSIEGDKVYIVDAKGNKAMVESADVNASNGVVHVIDSVLLPS